MEAFEDGANEDARENMAWGSLLGGLSLANAGLGAVHGFAGAIGGMYPAAHGAICAALLADVTEINIRALNQREPDNLVLERYQEAGMLFDETRSGFKYEIIDRLFELKEKLKIKSLKSIGVDRKDFGIIIEKAKNASSMKGNPIKLTEEELEEILIRAF